MDIDKIIIVRARQSTLDSLKRIVRYFNKKNSHRLYATTDPDTALSWVKPDNNYIFVTGNHFQGIERNSELSKMALFVRNTSPESIIIGYSSTFGEVADKSLDFYFDLNDKSMYEDISSSISVKLNSMGLDVQNYRLGTFLSLPFEDLERERLIEILNHPVDWEQELKDLKRA